MTALGFPFVPLVSANLLREPVVAEHARAGEGVVEEVSGLDVPMDDVGLVSRGEGAEEGGKVGAEEGEGRAAVVSLRGRGQR